MILGIGNPIMGDDGVGIYILRRLKKQIPPRNDLEFRELSVGGIKLVEELLDYKVVFIIDSIESATTTGEINEFSPEQLKNTHYDSSPHGMNFATALELYKKLAPSRIPQKIRIFTITIQPGYTFKETLTPTIQEAAAHLTDTLTEEIRRT